MSDYFDRVERQIVQRVEAGAPQANRRPTVLGYLATAAAVLVVIVVAGAFLLARGSSPTPTKPSAPAAGQTVSVTFEVSPIDPHAPARTGDRTLDHDPARAPGHDLPRHTRRARRGTTSSSSRRARRGTPRADWRILGLTAPGRLEIFDWEANALTPNGKTVASQLEAQKPRRSRSARAPGRGARRARRGSAVASLRRAALASKIPGSASFRRSLRASPRRQQQPAASARFYVLGTFPACRVRT